MAYIFLHHDEAVQVDDMEAMKIQDIITSHNPPKLITVAGQTIKVDTIQRVMTGQESNRALDRAESRWHQRNNEWRCAWGNWHSRQYDDCGCFHKYGQQTDTNGISYVLPQGENHPSLPEGKHPAGIYGKALASGVCVMCGVETKGMYCSECNQANQQSALCPDCDAVLEDGECPDCNE